MEKTLYSIKGTKAGSITLPSSLFEAKWNADLVHQVITSMESNQRANTAHTQNRGEVEGSRAKPWKQKGTGRARHGDKRSPIWKGGGVTHGPRNDRNYKKTITQAVKNVALASVLSRKVKGDTVLFTEKVNLTDAKTKDAAGILATLSKIDGAKNITRKDARVCLVVAEAPRALINSFRNIPQITLVNARQLSPQDIVMSRYVIVTDAEAAVSVLQARIEK